MLRQHAAMKKNSEEAHTYRGKYLENPSGKAVDHRENEKETYYRHIQDCIESLGYAQHILPSYETFCQEFGVTYQSRKIKYQNQKHRGYGHKVQIDLDYDRGKEKYQYRE